MNEKILSFPPQSAKVAESKFSGSINTSGISGGGGGGGMDEVYKRLGAVETSVSDIKSAVSGLTHTIPHLATKADVEKIETSISRTESSLIKWLIGTVLTVAAIATSILFAAITHFGK